MKILGICNKIIEFSFYSLFLLVPLVFSSKTSELFEFNKMWLTFCLTILVISAWIVKMVVLKKIWVQKTPLDIPIIIFLVSQIISTIVSLDPYISIWGYYSRFNGGLLSIFSYVLLYYAFVSNFSLSEKSEDFRSKVRALTMVKRILGISLVSGAVVALWGLPSHFGYDPTCFLFRRTLDVSCWTADFQPKVRIFSTLGQPAWLGAYLAILSPLAIAMAISNFKSQISNRTTLFAIGYMLLAVLFYIDILFTKSRAALIAFWISIGVFATFYYLFEIRKKVKKLTFKNVAVYAKPLLFISATFLIATAIVMSPFELKVNKGKVQIQNQTSKQEQVAEVSFASGGGGTESGKIRLLVWSGALNIWKNYPIFGTGVETFAFGYYKYRPVAHNLTSEWNYLYNKAHNEYLNYLATTGIVGLGSYLLIIGTFLYLSLKHLLKIENFKLKILIPALLAGYLSILITNFFGFSTVLISLYFFLIPAFVFVLCGMLKQKNVWMYNFNPLRRIEASPLRQSFSEASKSQNTNLSFLQKIDIVVVSIVTVYLIAGLANFWLADQSFALGSNLSHSGQYEQAYLNLKTAAERVDFEPTFKDELASNDSILAVSILSSFPEDKKQASQAAELAQSLAREAIITTTQLTTDHPNNIVFLKTKVRVFYTLSQIDPKYLSFALEAIKKAKTLAPTDANISYNLGLLYGQSGDTKKAIEVLNETIKLKPNYANAYYALGLFYRQLATNERGTVINEGYKQKAIDQMEFILKKLDPQNEDAKYTLEQWSGQ